MDAKEIKRLLEAVASSDVSEFTLETGDYKISVKRGSAPQAAAAAPAPSAPQPSAASAPAAAAEPQPSAPAAKAPEPSTPGLHEITAPIVGTFYAAPSPDAPSYVKVGDRVEQGKVLCIIEAMKLMNEIEAEVAGTVREILVRNEEPVEYGQALFRIEPG